MASKTIPNSINHASGVRCSAGNAEIRRNDNEILPIDLLNLKCLAVKQLDEQFYMSPWGTNLSFQTGQKTKKKQLQVMASMHRLLRFALEQDPGRAETPREGLILFIVRLAIRVESYGRLVVEQRHRVGKRQVDAKQQSLEGMLGSV